MEAEAPDEDPMGSLEEEEGGFVYYYFVPPKRQHDPNPAETLTTQQTLKLYH